MLIKSTFLRLTLLRTILVFGVTAGAGAPIAGLSPFLISPVQADTVIVIKDQSYHWSLADWLEQRDRMRLQDLWFALHSGGSPYEFYISGNYQFNQLNGTQTYQAWEGSLAAFVAPFGLEARYESGLAQRVFGIFDLRILGFHDQATNLTLQLGIRNETNSLKSFRNLFTGASLTLYLVKSMGVEGLYRHFLPSTPNEIGQNVSGTRIQAGAFLVFSNTRLYLNYFSDAETNWTANGVTGGFRLYLQ